MNLTFSKQKSALLVVTNVEFLFVGLDVMPETYCYFARFQHLFWKR